MSRMRPRQVFAKFNSNLSGYIVIAAGVLSSVLGLAVIAGWFLQNSTLLRLHPSFEPMRFNTALGFLMSGAALLSFSLRKRALMKPFGLAACLLGILTFFQYVSGIDIGIDQIFVQDAISSTYPGRMAPNTALGFSFTGAALLLLGAGASRNRNLAAGLLGSVTAALGLTALLGYLTGVMSMSAWEDFIAMALHTATGFVAVGSAIIALAIKDDGSQKNPIRLLPVIIGVGVLTGTLVFWRALVVQERVHIDRTVELKAKAARDTIQNEFETRTQALLRMAKRWEAHGRPLQRIWESDAGYYIRHFNGYRAIGWVDPSFSARWVVTQSSAGKPGAAGIEGALKNIPAASPGRKELMLSDPFVMDGRNVFMSVVPMTAGEEFEGFIVGIFNIDELFDSILPGELAGLYSVEVLTGDNELYAKKYGAFTDAKWSHESALSLTGADWTVRVRPTPAALRQMQTRLPEVILAAGLVMSLLFALAIHYAQTSRSRAEAAEAANIKLGQEVMERKRAEEEAEGHAAELADANARLELEIVERKKAVETVARHSAELERSNAELEQFAYVASHDLQEPLRVIGGYAQLLSKRYRGRLDSDADEFISFVVDGTNRMQLLISDLLAYSKVGSRDRVSNPCDCNSIVRETMTTLKAAMDESKATVTHDQLPTVMADKFQLMQLFQNLIGNAIKYRGKKPPSVHISSMMNGSEWVFSVQDNGIGIDPRYHDRIFVIFQRLHGKGEYSGTGIGLAICKKVVENHNGKIWVNSAPETGSTFYFSIPI